VQIRIDTDRAREVGRRLVAEGDHLAEMAHELQRAIGRLDTWAWDGRSRRRAEPMLRRVRPESERVARDLENLGRKLAHVADVFEQVDRDTVRAIAPLPSLPSDWLPGERLPQDWGALIGAAIVTLDGFILRFLNDLLPWDSPRAEEYFTLEGKGGGTIPLGEFGLPFSGYLSGENDITVIRNADGTFSVIIGRAGAVGADFSTVKLGARVGLRGEQGYEFIFDPNSQGDLSRMALLLTTLGSSAVLSAFGPAGAQMAMVAEKATVSSLRDNMVFIGGAVGVEGEVDIDLEPVAEIEYEGTRMTGVTMRRDGLDDQSWDRVTSYKLTDEVEGNIRILDVLKAEGRGAREFTVNQIVDMQTGDTATEVVLEFQYAFGVQASPADRKDLLPPGVDLDISAVRPNTYRIVYRIDEPAESVINTLREGAFDSIVQNSSVEVTTRPSAKTLTVGGELKKSLLPGQTAGVELEMETSSGYQYTAKVP
jgi:uncharacterized protein YukE